MLSWNKIIPKNIKTWKLIDTNGKIAFDNQKIATTLLKSGYYLLLGLDTDNQSFTSSGLLRLNTDGTVDDSFRGDNGLFSVGSITPLPSGDNIVVGQRSEHGSDIEVFTIDSSGSLKAHLFIDRTSAAVDQSGGSILLGGYFNSSRNIILRLYNQGSNFRSLSTRFTGQLFDIKLQTDGKVLIATNVFNAEESPPLRRLVRLNADAFFLSEDVLSEDEICMPIKASNGNMVSVCL